MWLSIKLWAFKYLGGLFMEEKRPGVPVISLGRVCFLAVLTWLMIFWTQWWAVAAVSAEAFATAVVALLPGGRVAEAPDLADACRRAVVALPNVADLGLPPGLMEAFYTLSGYVFGSKVLEGFKTKWTNGNGNGKVPASEVPKGEGP